MRFGRVKIEKRQNLIYLFVLSVTFSDVLNNGNLNLLYFFGAYLIIKDFKITCSFLRDLILYFVPFCIMVLVEISLSGNAFHYEKIMVYLLKILFCVSLLSYTKKYFWKINYLKIIDYICFLFGIMLVLSLITIEFPIFWRLDDAFNSFSKTRLQFLYSEPSVLGMVCGILVIILMKHVFDEKKNTKITKEVLLLGIIILLTFSMSGIIYSAISLIILYLYQLFAHRSHISRRMSIFLIVGICMIATILLTNNPISSRLFSMFHGLDGSYNFRWTAAITAFKNTMKQTNNWGMGLGNMNTPEGLSFLLNMGIDHKFANSFLYFSTENGFLGMLYLLYLFLSCVYGCIKSSRKNRAVKVALLSFAFISQVAGGYFTDPILWILYGIILSNDVGTTISTW